MAYWYVALPSNGGDDSHDGSSWDQALLNINPTTFSGFSSGDIVIIDHEYNTYEMRTDTFGSGVNVEFRSVVVGDAPNKITYGAQLRFQNAGGVDSSWYFAGGQRVICKGIGIYSNGAYPGLIVDGDSRLEMFQCQSVRDDMVGAYRGSIFLEDCHSPTVHSGALVTDYTFSGNGPYNIDIELLKCSSSHSRILSIDAGDGNEPGSIQSVKLTKCVIRRLPGPGVVLVRFDGVNQSFECTRCDFVQSDYGIQLQLGDYNLTLNSCIFADLDLAVRTPGGASEATGNIIFKYCLFHNVTDYVNESLTNTVESNCIIGEDPLFVDPLTLDFQIEDNSPCVNAGDPALPQDPDFTVADIGAFYAHQDPEYWVPPSTPRALLDYELNPLIEGA